MSFAPAQPSTWANMWNPSRIGLQWLVFAVGSVALVAWCYLQGIGLNNGDYSRVFESMGIYAEGWRPLADSYPLNDNPRAMPGSAMALLGYVLSTASQVIGMEKFHTVTMSLSLNLIFLGGMFAIARQAQWKWRWALIAVHALLYFLYSFYLRSLFEEAMVLAVAPWLTYGAKRALVDGEFLALSLSALVVMTAKAQMIFLLPLLVGVFIKAIWELPRKRQAVAILLAAGLCVASVLYVALLAGKGMQPANQYNRYYNGLGWSLQRVASWPPKDFNGRLKYSTEHGSELRRLTAGYDGAELLGTSYWPTGNELSVRYWTGVATPAERQQFQDAFSTSSLKRFFGFFKDHPALAPSYFANVYGVAFLSDYSTEYIAPPRSSGGLVASLNDARTKVASGLGLISALLVALGMALRPSWANILLGGYFILGAPLFVVVGDGYYEFEKHMAPYIMLSGAVLMAVMDGSRLPRPWANRRNGAPTTAFSVTS